MNAGEVYQSSDEERARWTKACDRLAADPDLCAKLAKARGWKPDTIHALALQGSLGWKDGKFCFFV